MVLELEFEPNQMVLELEFEFEPCDLGFTKVNLDHFNLFSKVNLRKVN